MLQIKRRKDGKLGWRFMFTICFYQDSRHEKPLYWIREKLQIGYISKRNDGITELRINGYKQARDILELLLPFVRFKKPQAEAVYRAASLLVQNSVTELSKRARRNLLNWMLQVQSNNYVTRRKKTRTELEKILGLTP